MWVQERGVVTEQLQCFWGCCLFSFWLQSLSWWSYVSFLIWPSQCYKALFICGIWVLYMLNLPCCRDSRQKQLEHRKTSAEDEHRQTERRERANRGRDQPSEGREQQPHRGERWIRDKLQWNGKPQSQPDPKDKPVRDRDQPSEGREQKPQRGES